MRKTQESGFTLVELLAAMAFTLMVTSAIFLILNTAVQRQQAQSQVLDSFQEARLAIDQMTRDIHGAGFPPANSSWGLPSASTAHAFAWAPGYAAGTTCTVGGTCTSPSTTDLIVEGNISPTTGTGIQWIRYQLNGTTLMRGIATKIAGVDPTTATSAAGVLFPYVDNVINNAGTPVFTYECANGTTPVVCTGAPAPNNTAAYIRQVGITLVVQSAQRDPKTGQFATVSLHADALVANPTQ